jgi:hypothetical protein
LATSAFTQGPFAKADAIMREELLCLHPSLPALIADQPTVTKDELQVAMRDVLRHFEGALPPTFTGEKEVRTSWWQRLFGRG